MEDGRRGNKGSSFGGGYINRKSVKSGPGRQVSRGMGGRFQWNTQKLRLSTSNPQTDKGEMPLRQMITSNLEISAPNWRLQIRQPQPPSMSRTCTSDVALKIILTASGHGWSGNGDYMQKRQMVRARALSRLLGLPIVRVANFHENQAAGLP